MVLIGLSTCGLVHFSLDDKTINQIILERIRVVWFKHVWVIEIFSLNNLVKNYKSNKFGKNLGGSV